MKNRLLRISILSIMTGLFLIAVVGCKKDDNKDDDPPVVVKKYRITNVKQTQGSDASESKLAYNSDNKLISFDEYENDVAIYKSNWTWTGNEAKLVESFFDGNQWIEGPYYEIYTYTNNHLTEARAYEGEDTLSYKVTYTWDGDRVTKEKFEYFYEGTMVSYTGNNYIYTGAQLTTVERTMFDQVQQKQVIGYTNGKPVSLKTFSNQDVLEESIEMIYTGNLMTKINTYNVAQGVAGTVRCSEDRTYDSNNNASTINLQCTGETPFNSNLTWEEGTGNLSDVVLANIGWLTVYLFPDTFPSELVFMKKSPNSSFVGTGRDLSITD